MKQPDFVEFKMNRSDSYSTELESPISFSRVKEVDDSESINRRKRMSTKRQKTQLAVEELEELRKLKSLTVFPLSMSLMNLLRDPKVEEHEFDESFLAQVENNLKAIISKSSHKTNRHNILYLHLILAQIENLQEL